MPSCRCTYPGRLPALVASAGTTGCRRLMTMTIVSGFGALAGAGMRGLNNDDSRIVRQDRDHGDYRGDRVAAYDALRKAVAKAPLREVAVTTNGVGPALPGCGGTPISVVVTAKLIPRSASRATNCAPISVRSKTKLRQAADHVVARGRRCFTMARSAVGGIPDRWPMGRRIGDRFRTGRCDG